MKFNLKTASACCGLGAAVVIFIFGPMATTYLNILLGIVVGLTTHLIGTMIYYVFGVLAKLSSTKERIAQIDRYDCLLQPEGAVLPVVKCDTKEAAEEGIEVYQFFHPTQYGVFDAQLMIVEEPDDFEITYEDSIEDSYMLCNVYEWANDLLNFVCAPSGYKEWHLYVPAARKGTEEEK